MAIVIKQIHIRVILLLYILGVQTNFINHPGARVIVQVVSELSLAKRVQQSTVGKKMK